MKLPTIYIEFYPYLWSKYVKQFCRFHFGFSDRCLFWYANGKVMDFLFININ